MGKNNAFVVIIEWKPLAMPVHAGPFQLKACSQYFPLLPDHLDHLELYPKMLRHLSD